MVHSIRSSELAHIIRSHETQSLKGDLMIRANPQDVMLYNRSSNYYNNMFITYLFSDFINVLVFNPEKGGNLCIFVSLLDVTPLSLPSLIRSLKFTFCHVSTKTGTRRKLRFKRIVIRNHKTSVDDQAFCIRWPENRQFKSCIIFRYVKSVFPDFLLKKYCEIGAF